MYIRTYVAMYVGSYVASYPHAIMFVKEQTHACSNTSIALLTGSYVRKSYVASYTYVCIYYVRSKFVSLLFAVTLLPFYF